MAETLKGRYRPRNPEKYRGDVANIFYRSSWELDIMRWLDKRTDIIWWMSEERCVWYYNPITKKNARYFPDFIIHYRNKEGIEITEVLEVKPKRQVKGPNPNPKRKTKAWVKSVQTYLINQAKWDAATGWCEDRGYNFRLITEDHMPKWNK